MQGNIKDEQTFAGFSKLLIEEIIKNAETFTESRT
jgi:hypothetical protein